MADGVKRCTLSNGFILQCSSILWPPSLRRRRFLPPPHPDHPVPRDAPPCIAQSVGSFVDVRHFKTKRERKKSFRDLLPWRRRKEGAVHQGNLSARARIHRHVGVDFEHHVFVLVKEEDAEGGHLLWDAARLRDAGHHAHRPHDALDRGVVGRLQGLKVKRTPQEKVK